VAEPLLLIHGFTDSARTWDGLRPLLEPYHELLVPTLTGHRGGPPIPSGMTDALATMADGLEKVLDDAGHERAHLVGNSLGGWMAFELASRGRALTVVGLSPAMGWGEDGPPAATRRQFVRAHRAGPYAARLAKLIATRPRLRKLAFADLIAHPERVPPRTAYELIKGSAACPMFEPYVAQVEANDYRGKWQPIDVPVRIAWGEKDWRLPAKSCSPWYRESFPDAEWVDLPDCGHLPQHDDPQLVARTILEVTAPERAARSQVST
jgi:pimeloyl-ACP methyl ester carboxylesterase